ncbi:DUF262 domain-containing protein [Xylanibacter rodentium]|mgnify:CR=1 FL=1|uniref:DUF262 domain-containing protein n=1 Tax=Xylanibacter rodentium TaxID=2736289 RepID=UPI002585434B|nr:DUF262 domain-containing protein [Xylanibacter rodentium]
MSKIESDKTLYKLLSEPLLVPDYQRDYAQGRVNDLKILDTRVNFVADIIAAATNQEHIHLGLVFGSDNNGLQGFVAVDGQQRLTTCFLYHIYICKSLAGQANENLSIRLRKFGWFGRIYVSEFTEFLLDSVWNVKPNKTLSDIFKQSKDYFTIWENDPTVNNMLVMLDEIHRQMSKITDYTLKDIESNLISDNCKLNFDYMKLEPGTDEFQYQKMNSRGRDLTSYELFKQKFLSECHVSEDLKEKLDNQWLIFFDELAAKEKLEADIFLQNYINETALWMGVKTLGDSYQYISQIEKSKLRDNRTDVGFVAFDAYKEFSQHLSEWEYLTDWLVINYATINQCIEKFWYIDESTRLIDFFKSADYQVRAVNYAICHYAINTGYQTLDTENFVSWWRPIHNLIANTEIYRNNFHNIIKAIDKLPTNSLLTFLRDENLSGFSEYQREEERRKALICLNEPKLIELFYCQEKRKRFHGQIGILLPDNNCLSTKYWECIVSVYENVVGDRYISSEKSDFDFIMAMLTFVGNDYHQDNVKGLNLKYENGYLMGFKIPARWIHEMIFKFIDKKKEDGSLTPENFLGECRKAWLSGYSTLSYKEKKEHFWIKYILDNPKECEKLFNDSHYGKLTKKDSNLWLYLKSNRNDRDILLSNRRKEVLEHLSDLEVWWIDKHDVVKRYSDFPYLKVVFTSDKIWIGIDHNNELVMPEKLPDNIHSDFWHKAWSWFPDDILNNYYEHEDESFISYVETLSKELRRFCEKFIANLNLNTLEENKSVHGI